MSEEKKTKQTMDLLHGPLWNKILLFAIPIAASSILQQLFNSADVAVVGRFAGSQALAAVGSNQAAINLLINLFVGLSVGANVMIARYIGENKADKIQTAVHTAIMVALVSGIFLIGFGFFMSKFILELMDTPEDVIDLATLYLRIYFAGMPFMMLYNFGAAILRSKGDTRRPLVCLVVSGIVNVILNLFFVIVCGISVAGVGIATVLANVISSCMVVYFLMHEEGELKLRLNQLRIDKKVLLDMAKIGVPAGVQGMVFSLSNVCIQTALNGFGSLAVAGNAAAINFEFFAYFLMNSFTQAAVTFVSQNFGAGNYKRCRKIVLLCVTAGAVSSGILSAIFVIGGKWFIRIYTTDPEAIQYGLTRMRHILTFQFINAVMDVTAGVLRGVGYSVVPAVITIAGVCGLRLLWVQTIFPRTGTFEMLVNVYPVTWVITAVLMIVVYLIISKRVFAQRRENG